MAVVNLVLLDYEGNYLAEKDVELAGVPLVGDKIMVAYRKRGDYAHGMATDRWWNVGGDSESSVSVEVTLDIDAALPPKEWGDKRPTPPTS